MLKKHVVLFEAKNYGWIAYSTTFADAKRVLTINDTQQDIFYIFECNLLKQNPYTMKLKFPFPKHYNHKKINIYTEDEFEDNEEYILISYDDADGGIRLDVNKGGV
jgi:hypothetical protein